MPQRASRTIFRAAREKRIHVIRKWGQKCRPNAVQSSRLIFFRCSVSEIEQNGPIKLPFRANRRKGEIEIFNGFSFCCSNSGQNREANQHAEALCVDIVISNEQTVFILFVTLHSTRFPISKLIVSTTTATRHVYSNAKASSFYGRLPANQSWMCAHHRHRQEDKWPSFVLYGNSRNGNGSVNPVKRAHKVTMPTSIFITNFAPHNNRFGLISIHTERF